MKNHRKRDQNSLKHLHDIENVGLEQECPLKLAANKKSSNTQVIEVVTWLKLQNHKMGYRLLYLDIAVCCAYIIFLFTVLKFNAQVLPNRWFYGLTIIVLVGSCVLFIGIHLLPYKIQAVKNSPKTLSEDWDRYRNYFKSWAGNMAYYLVLLFICLSILIYNENQPSRMIISLLLVLIVMLYGYGIKIIIKALRIKEDTTRYMAEIGKTKLTTLKPNATGGRVECRCEKR